MNTDAPSCMVAAVKMRLDPVTTRDGRKSLRVSFPPDLQSDDIKKVPYTAPSAVYFFWIALFISTLLMYGIAKRLHESPDHPGSIFCGCTFLFFALAGCVEYMKSEEDDPMRERKGQSAHPLSVILRCASALAMGMMFPFLLLRVFSGF